MNRPGPSIAMVPSAASSLVPANRTTQMNEASSTAVTRNNWTVRRDSRGTKASTSTLNTPPPSTMSNGATSAYLISGRRKTPARRSLTPFLATSVREVTIRGDPTGGSPRRPQPASGRPPD